QAKGLQAQVQHPLRLVLQPGDVADDLLGQATPGRCAGDIGVGPAELVVPEAFQLRAVGDSHLPVSSLVSCAITRSSHYARSPPERARPAVLGACVRAPPPARAG